jgi:hypothetical protein
MNCSLMVVEELFGTGREFRHKGNENETCDDTEQSAGGKPGNKSAGMKTGIVQYDIDQHRDNSHRPPDPGMSRRPADPERKYRTGTHSGIDAEAAGTDGQRHSPEMQGMTVDLMTDRPEECIGLPGNKRRKAHQVRKHRRNKEACTPDQGNGEAERVKCRPFHKEQNPEKVS